MACNILQVCYENDANNTEITLTRKVPEFDNSTCIQAAVLAKDLDFISHPCFQTVLTRIWYNEIDPDINKIKVINHHTLSYNLISNIFNNRFI